MNVTFKNIGIIEEADIDLSKQLIVFSGPNNTGKTYLSYCIYGLNSINFLENFVEFDKLELLKPQKFDLYKLYSENKDDIQKYIIKSFLKNLHQYFGLDTIERDKIFNNADIIVNITDDEITEYNILKIEQKGSIYFSEDIKYEYKKFKDSLFVEIYPVGNSSKYMIDFSDINQSISSVLIKLIISSIFNNTFIFPVERNSIFTFSKELSLQRNILVDQILELNSDKNKFNNPLDLIERRATRYPLPVRDLLQISEDLANFQKNTTDFYEFAENLETELMGGKIIISKEGEVNFVPDKSKKTKLPIHISSSIVKSFSSLIIYLKHIARRGDLIIIDEPELNLHPDAQILMAQTIALLLNKNFKVLVNTHSDYIIKELNNQIIINSISDNDLLSEYNYTENNKINPNDVAAYLFNISKSNRKLKVKNIPVDKDGFAIDTIDDVINDLNNKTMDLFNHMDSENA